MISGKIIQLRAVERSDAAAYHLWINDRSTNQWRGLFHPHNAEDAAAWIEKHAVTNSTQITFAVETKNGEHIGFVGFKNICCRSRRAELWIYIGSMTHWGQDFGEDTIRTLCDYAFHDMNLFRIFLECDTGYPNVLRCYEKVGFRLEGTLRKSYYRHGAYRDTCIMALLRDET